MPEDAAIEAIPEQSNGWSIGKYLLIILVIFAILWAVNNHYRSGALQEKTAADMSSEDIREQDSGVPDGSVQRASDVLLYNEAIDKKDKTLCERITDKSLKSDCFKFFTVNGI